MRILNLFLSFCICTSGMGQLNSAHVLSDSARLKAKVQGNIRQLLRWTDHSGDNYLVLAETDKIQSTAIISKSGGDCKGGCYDKELYAYHFTGRDSLVWKLTDFERACSFDNVVEFRKGAVKITDLDKNGSAEIWIMYSIGCINGPAPRTLKLILYEGNKKYAVRGTSQPSKDKIDKEYGGRYNPDKAFQRLPQPFKTYAEKLWMENLYDLK